MDMQHFCPLVSIIIPVYNGSNYMREAIDSAIGQTYKNIEVIVINDGSNDDGKTEKIALSYGDSIRYIRKENGGVSTALNLGIKSMTGEYFSWLSHDDVYTEDKIQKSIEALAEIEDKKTIVYCQSVHIDKDSNLLSTVNKEAEYTDFRLESWDVVLKNLLRRGTMNGCAFLIHKSIFDECGYFDETLRFNQDGLMWNKIFLKGYSLLRIPSVCVKNRVHDKQLTQTGQKIFHKDCTCMSEFLIPELIKCSSEKRNFIYDYIIYNAKYANKNVVSKAHKEARKKGLITPTQKVRVWIMELYGCVRPYIRKLYYAVFRGIKTT